MTVVTLPISENKKKLVCVIVSHRQRLYPYYKESLRQDDTQGLDMRYPLKYDTTKKRIIRFQLLVK